MTMIDGDGCTMLDKNIKVIEDKKKNERKEKSSYGTKSMKVYEVK
jgi:hypothetical protein